MDLASPQIAHLIRPRSDSYWYQPILQRRHSMPPFSSASCFSLSTAVVTSNFLFDAARLFVEPAEGFCGQSTSKAACQESDGHENDVTNHLETSVVDETTEVVLVGCILLQSLPFSL